MRTTRAFIAGLGTTGSLLAATACAFLVTSALVAFNGWPGGGIADSIESLFVHDEPVRVGSVGPEGVAADSTVAAEAVASTPTGPVSDPAADVPAGTPGGPQIVQVEPGGGPTAPERGGLRGGPGSEVDGPGSGSSGAGAGARPVAPPAQGVPRRPNVGTSVSETTGTLGDTVSGTTDQVGGAVGGPVGDAVTGTGQAADDVVTGVGQQVGGALGQKSP